MTQHGITEPVILRESPVQRGVAAVLSAGLLTRAAGLVALAAGVVAGPLVLAATPVGAQVLPAPVLGGSPAPFEQIWGGSNDASIGALLHYQRCAGTQIDQYVLMAPNDQVWTIQHAECELTTPSAEQRFAQAAQFLPQDAVPGDSFTTELGESAVSWVSASLGAALPAGLFHDCAGKSLAPGTVFIVADSFGGWFMGPGTCPSP